MSESETERYYKRAIDIALEVDSDDNWDVIPANIIWYIAKNHPKILIESYEYLRYDYKNDRIVSELVSLIKEDRFIQAIKIYREYTGLGLREAKDFCDNLREQVRNNEI